MNRTVRIECSLALKLIDGARERRRQKPNLSFNHSFKACKKSVSTLFLLNDKQYCWQVDKGAEEAGVKGFAGRPLRLQLPRLQAARRPHRGHGGNHLEEDAGRVELADLPWSVDGGEREPEKLVNVNCVAVREFSILVKIVSKFSIM